MSILIEGDHWNDLHDSIATIPAVVAPSEAVVEEEDEEDSDEDDVDEFAGWRFGSR